MGDRGVRGEVVDDELAQVLRVGGGEPDEVVGRAREVEDGEDARQFADGVGEGLDLLAVVDGKAHGDHRLQRASERGEVDLGVETAQDAGFPEGAHALQRGRRRDTDALGEPVVRDPRVLAERFEDRAVGVVEAQAVRHERNCSRSAEEDAEYVDIPKILR